MFHKLLSVVGRDSVVSIETRYGLEVRRSNQGIKRPESAADHPHPHLAPKLKNK